MASSLFLLLALFFVAASASTSPALSRQEVHSLSKVAARLGMSEWLNFPAGKPCGDGTVVGCHCSFANGSVCHVTAINLKNGNLSGQLPPEFAGLPYLEKLDVSRNVLRGGIPSDWAQMKLKDLSLMANRLSGPFPSTLLQITTLTNLSIEGNGFHGSIPAEIGNVINLQKLVLSANEFTGELPSSLGRLENLTDLRISSNNFTGRIPNFLKKLTKLQKLHIQGSSLEGPIPASISMLTALSDLRISDIRLRGSSFPDLSGMPFLKILILRNCSISGNIPSYISGLMKLKHLDLSFNKLSGVIPASFTDLAKVDFIYLTGNMLSGSIPEWMLQRNKNTDISCNNFTLGSSGPTQCLQGSINAVESYSSEVADKKNVEPCLKKNFPCSASKYRYELHINCGGNETVINGTKYESDAEQRGASMMYLGSSWAFSSTGSFMDNDKDADNYVATNTSMLTMKDQELYTQARLSPLSLTYYGLCMINGNYTVNLHFAEIMFTDDNTFSSLGKRLFNVYIQDNMVIENFNIQKSGGGNAKPVVKTFTAYVIDHTLKIHFYWAGKGTTGIPYRGVYGPLISAISVVPNFEPPLAINPTNSKRKSNMISRMLEIGIPVLACLLILLSVGIICFRKRRTASMYQDLKAFDLQTGSFTLRQIKAATNNFDAANKIGEGGFGSVYKGLLSDGTIIAVKQLSSRSRQGNREFVNEIGLISALQHPNLVKLYGCCIEGNQLLLVYEYMENNSLARALFDVQYKLNLGWPIRSKICLGIARALAYLHEESALKIVHRDIKGSNILLDKDLNAKISDFGLAKLNEDGQSHISTRIAGTIGYMAPEYAMRGYLTEKADVYSFGVVALEIVSGKSNTNYRPKEEFVYLLDWACVLQERGTLLELVDPDLGSNYSKEEAILILNVALLCTNSSPTLRPKMSKVVSLLEGQTPLQPLLSDLSLTTSSLSSSGMHRNFWQHPSGNPSFSINNLSTNSSETSLAANQS